MALSNTQRVLVFGLGALMGTMILMISRDGKRAAIQHQLEQDIKKGYVQDGRYYPGQEFQARNPIYITPDVQSEELPVNPENNQFVRYLLTPGRFSFTQQDLAKELLWRDPETGFERLLRRQYMEPNRCMVRLKPDISLSLLEESLKKIGCTLGEQKSSRSYFVNIAQSVTPLSVHQTLQALNKVDSIELAFPAYIDPNPKNSF